MKKSLLIKSSGLYCINFEHIDDVSVHDGGNMYKVLLFSKQFRDPVFILYYKEFMNMDIAYRNIRSIIDNKAPGKIIKVDFRKE